jgi:histidinol-phosphate/aromatic aminotransferase/cobyric acid decarboxylase-like protein
LKRPRLLDYYRQFEALSPEEDSRRMRARRDADRSAELELAPALDLSSSEWHEPPDPEIVNAATFALRRSLNRYPEVESGAARAAVAARHGLPEEQVALGHGAGQLIQAAVRSLAAGGEVLMPWPSWGPLPALILRSAAKPVPVPGDLDAAIAAAGDDTRAIVLCSPNDPTGRVLTPDEVRHVAGNVPPHVTVLLDEALVDFAGEAASCVPLVQELPNLLVFRSFSKAWALAGLRIGYAAGPPEAAPLLSELTPGLGVSSPGQYAVVAALEGHDRVRARLDARRRTVAAERDRLAQKLQGTGFSFPDSQAHVVWLAHEHLDARSIFGGLEDQRIQVAHGADWNDAAHVRVTLRDRASTERLVSALKALSGP